MGLADFFFPRNCLGCCQPEQYFCFSCRQSIRPPKPPFCPKCLKPSILGASHIQCLKPLFLDGLVAVFRYEKIIKTGIKKLKYKFVTDLAQELADLTVERIKKYERKFWPKFDSGWVLTIIPLHPKRERWRGFNQMGILGELVARKMGWQFRPELLERTKLTAPQAKIKDKKKRRANVRWAFRINPDSGFLVNDSKFILFDDVWTTGSTIKESGQVLKRRGARKVWALTLAS
jgi:competence protein ComFC